MIRLAIEIESVSIRYIALIILQFGIFITGGSAFAADLPVDKSPLIAPAPPPAFSWTGFYAGVSGGYGIDHVSYPFAFNDGPAYAPGRSGLTERGGAVGLQIGYNYQLSDLPLVGDHLVIGVEGDAAWSGINGASTTPTAFGPATFGTRIETFGGIEGRVGYAFDRLLIFFQGGVPYATTKSYYNAEGFSGSSTETRFRIGRQNLVGAGAEYAFDQNWSVRADYVYSFVGAWWKSFSPAPGVNIGYMTRTSFHTVRASVDYHFDLFAPATPVVAKY
jgi:outer membrane immunogenic protein